jgi:hypothetical protein
MGSGISKDPKVMKCRDVNRIIVGGVPAELVC